jgi:hypothetical protein
MPVEILSTKVVRDGDDNATSFSFPFVITEASDLVVNLVDDDGVEDSDPLEQGVDYSVVPSGTYPTTGSINYPLVGDPLPAGWQIIIRRVLPLTQTTRLRNQGGYFAEVQEGTFDRLCMQIQQLQEQIDRAFLLPLLGFENLAGAVPRVNATETAIEYALGLTGAPGAPGVAGAAGPAGPWEFLGTHTLSGTETDIAAADLGSASHRAIMLVLLGVTTNTDATNFALQLETDSVLRTADYHRTSLSLHAGSATPGGAVSTAGSNINVTGVTAGVAQLGNAAGESCDATVIIYDPHTAGKIHRVSTEAVFANTSGNVCKTSGSGQYVGTGSTDAITGIRITHGGVATMTGTVLVFGLRAENAKVPVVAAQFTPGVLGASQIVLRYVFTEDATIGIDFAGSQASAGVAADAEAVFGISLNGSPGPTMTFAIAGDTATFDNSGADLDVVAGDVLEITAPASPDATLADLAISIRALADSV